MFVSIEAGWMLRARHYAAIDTEYGAMSFLAAYGLFLGGSIWVFYLAVEPYVRRFWPELLIGWSRLLSGRVRDPLVGRDVLVGIAMGTIGALLIAARELVPRWFGLPLARAILPDSTLLLGGHHVLSTVFQYVRYSLTFAMWCVCIVVFFKIVVRRTWLVLLLSTIVLQPIAVGNGVEGSQLGVELSIALLGTALVFATLLRFGFLALLTMFYVFLLTDPIPLTFDFSRPYAGASTWLLVGVAGLAAFAFAASRGDEPLFGRDLLS